LYLYFNKFYEKNTNPTKIDVQFDEYGLITPKEIIELSLGDFERIFIKNEKSANIDSKFLMSI